MNKWDACMNEWLDGWMNQRVNGRINQWMNGWMTWMNEWSSVQFELEGKTYWLHATLWWDPMSYYHSRHRFCWDLSRILKNKMHLDQQEYGHQQAWRPSERHDNRNMGANKPGGHQRVTKHSHFPQKPKLMPKRKQPDRSAKLVIMACYFTIRFNGWGVNRDFFSNRCLTFIFLSWHQRASLPIKKKSH